MSSFANYKFYKPKHNTPVTYFHCAYCGKYQSRRTSKIKNKNLIFCDNSCRAKYISRLSFEHKFTNTDIIKYYKLFEKEISYISSNTAVNSGIPNVYDDLKKQAYYCILKCLQNKKGEDLKKEYFTKTYKKYLQKFLLVFEYTNDCSSINFFDTPDNILEFSYFDDLETKIDSVSLILKLKKDMVKLPFSCKIAIAREIFGISIDELSNKLNVEKRKIVYNCSKGKELLRLKYAR